MSIQRIAALLVCLLLLTACAPKAVVVTDAEKQAAAPQLSAENIFFEGQSLLENKDYDRAVSRLETFVQRYPRHPLAPKALMHIGTAHTAKGRYDSAREAYRRVISEYPGSDQLPEAHIGLVSAYYYEGRFKDAVAAAHRAMNVAATDSYRERILAITGDAYMALDAPSDAAVAYVDAYLKADEKIRPQLLDKLTAAMRLLNKEDVSAVIGRLSDPDAVNMVRRLAQELIYRRYTIGCLLPLSGPYELFGHRALAGIESALNRYSAATPNPQAEILVRDTGGDTRQALDMLDDLANAGAAAILGPIVTSPAVAEKAQQLGIPIITFTQKEHITQLGDYVFRNFITPKMQVDALVSYAVKDLNISRFAVLYPEDSYGNRFMDLFWNRAIDEGAQIAGIESYGTDQTDFAESIKKLVGRLWVLPEDLEDEVVLYRQDAPPLDPRYRWLQEVPGNNIDGLYFRLPAMSTKVPAARIIPPGSDFLAAAEPEKKPDEEPTSIVDFGAVFIPDAPKTAGLIIPQLAYYDIRDARLLGTNIWHSDMLIKMSRDYVQGAVFPDGFLPDAHHPVVQAFTRFFEATHQRKPGFVEAIGYDSATLLLDLIGRPGIRSRSQLRDQLLRVSDFPGVTGLTAFDFDGEARKQPYLITIRGDQMVEIDSAPAPLPPLTPEAGQTVSP